MSRLTTLLFCTALGTAFYPAGAALRDQPELGAHSAPILTINGRKFRDLNRDGALNPYEDWRLSPQARADDLVHRMTIREKAGVMLHGTLRGAGGPMAEFGFGLTYDLAAARKSIVNLGVNSFITRLQAEPVGMAQQNNAVQEIAEQSRLGIPVTISTDPRNHFQNVAGASSASAGYSQWPEPLGFAALRDPARVKHFADIVRAEYRATGIQQALSPTADLASEPLWSRGTSTFGSDPVLSSALVQAYVAGFQGGNAGLERDGVFAVVKHWVGYGALPGGLDSHNYYGRVAKLDTHSFATHLRPFEGAFAAKVAGVMPTYAILDGAVVDGKPVEPVAAGFNTQILTTLLRGRYRYKGVVLSDFGIMGDCDSECVKPTKPQTLKGFGMPWGVEQLSELDRYAKGINAGLDQIGGSENVEMILAAIDRNLVSEARIDKSVRRILITKFQMGLFENPYVDVARAQAVTTSPAIAMEATRAQAESQILLRNQKNLLPLASGRKIYLQGVDPAKASAHGLIVVDDPAKADVALIRADAPSESLHPLYLFGSRQHEGRLDFRPGEAQYEAIKGVSAKTPVILSVFLDRPAVLTQIVPLSSAILANFGVSDDALLDVVAGKAKAKGRLPFELPSSMVAVERQNPAIPDDSDKPLYRFGDGLVQY